MRSLSENGPSSIVPIRTPDTEKAALQAVLQDGETISGVTRELWQKFIKKRTKKKTKIMTNKKYISVLCWTKGKKHGWLVDLCDAESSDTIESFKHESEARAFALKYAEENGLEIKLQ